MKKLLITLMLLLCPLAMAYNVGYVDYAAFTMQYPQSLSYKKQMDAKVTQIKTYAEQSQKLVDSKKTDAEKIKVGNERVAQLNRMKKEYNDLKNKRDELVRQKIKEGSNKVVQSKKVDVIIAKSLVISGGIDVTQDVLKAVK